MTIRRDRMYRHAVRARVAPLMLALGSLAIPSVLGAQGRLRELFCRGNTGMVIRVDQDPSPRDTAQVTMVLQYDRPTRPPGDDTRKLEPGTCTWNALGFPGVLAEPGRVRFDVLREAQRWSATGKRLLDTTARAAMFFPDPITLPRYIQSSNNYFRFFVDDVTNLASSFGAMFESGLPTYVTIEGPVVLANDARRDLLCRGGTSGLLYGGGATVGNNLAKVQLTYRLSPNVPGASGSGLAPGSCAWTSRTAMPPEPGKIWFVTASNAQLRQMQSGVPIDRSPTAAERYPDMRSIPEYLKDPAHFWTFAVTSRKPDSALTNSVWKPDLKFMAASPRDAGTATVRAQPTATGPAGRPYSPDAANATSRANTLWDIRNVQVTPGLEGVAIKFDAAANSRPTVTVLPVGGAPIQLAVGSSPGTSGMMRYSAASNTKLLRDAGYVYTISASATGNARANTQSGTFKTLGQRVTISISQIYLVSDGDADSPGEVVFGFESCTPSITSYYLTGPDGSRMSWGEGPHRTSIQLRSTATVPDRFRIVIVGSEDDGADVIPLTSRAAIPPISCSRPDTPPGNNSTYEWNSLLLDFDLTRYPGTRAGDSFARRSKPLANGSTLSFEIRGSFQVTRQ